ncbi:MAG TPA: peptide-methionine (S)-S-oxide reductase MsrA [Spirochaetia bacterium]|nr:peptide-methionine (S)-S-oxide reductase MsrA [Spirochaetia bacterium]
MSNGEPGRRETATFGGGCFWCMEAVLQRIEGVLSVTSGYAGGSASQPSYEQVCTGDTGHAEVVQVEFDPHLISYEELLDVFWQAHDPTTLNQQGADVGTQYKSIILTTDDEQKKLAEASRKKAQKNWHDPIVTEIRPLEKFWKAEDYHQNYYNTHTSAGYCRVVISPKLRKLKLE